MEHALTRRTLLAVAGAAALLPAGPARAAAGLTPLPPGAPDRRLFSPHEQRFAPYLVTLAPMVGDMDDSGFFAGGWWRSPAAPYNARVQEHVHTLAWFHTKRRAWNPYRGDPALLAALDAALGHYLGLQHEDGSWSEYSADQHSLAATGFALGYLSKTLALLRESNALPARRTQLSAALHRAMTWFLDPGNDVVWQAKLTWANQVTAGLAGSALALNLDRDPTLRRGLADAFARIAAVGQSPAGFFYEESGMDMNYNFEVMLPELADAWRQSGDRNLVSMAAGYTGWLGYNLLREPDGSGWLTNIAPSSRTSALFYDDTRPDPERTALGSVFIPRVPALGAFMSAREDLAAARAAWAADTSPVPVLAKQNTSPRILTHALYAERYAHRQAKERALAEVPYLASERFTERRGDLGQEFLFLRRPGLYLGGYFGARRATTLARTGLTFLWHPVAGTVVHSLNNNNYACWATVFPGQKPDANGPQAVEFLGGEPYAFRFGTSSVATDVTVADGLVRRSVRAGAAATEQIPLVVHPTDEVVFTDGTAAPYGGSVTATADGIDLRRNGVVIALRWGTPRKATFGVTSVSYLRDGKRRLHVLRVPHDGAIDVTITLPT
ncbi:hypothetical protein [Nonomuraea helvata]|uniref:Tat pathway signal sequence domain protein n=1 Tax=Nonomuraea helvata TaxID=37484 RepID=A0ABV5S177_9ACTN